MRLSWLPISALGLALIGSCSGSTPVVTNALRCEDSVDQLSQLPEGSISAGGLAFPSEAAQYGTRAGEVGSPYEGLRYSKFGLMVQVDEMASLEVVRPPLVLLDWVPQNQPTSGEALLVGPCQAIEPGWLVFAGGVWMPEPACVEFRISDIEQTKTETVRIAVGVSCP